jgi:uncharacterized protein (TIGR03086 family)
MHDVAPDLLDLLRRAASSTGEVLELLGPQNQELPSPCPEMTVGQVAAHLVGGLLAFAQVVEGGELSFDEALDPVPGDEPVAVVFRAAVDQLVDAFSAPGRMEATYAMPWGPTTGMQLVGFELIETVTHGWDIARGLGVVLEVDDDVADATLAGARMWVDESVRMPGMFGAEVAVGRVAPLESLVAFLGRDPAWSRPSSTG